MFTAVQREEFDEFGFVRLPGVVEAGEAVAMEAQIWRLLEQNGVNREDRSTWESHRAAHLQKIRRNDKEPATNPAVHAAIDSLFGADVWVPPSDWGQALVTFPTEGPWTLPHHVWHLDHDYRYPRDAIWGLNLFLFIGDVVPRAGGTLVVRSSHRVVDAFVAEVSGLEKKKMKLLRNQFNARYEYFRDLASAEPDPGRTDRYMGSDTLVDGVCVRVEELTGSAGDVVVCHPWLVHNGSANVTDRPRLMRACRVYHRDLHTLRQG
jgi:hypothetical protein